MLQAGAGACDCCGSPPYALKWAGDGGKGEPARGLPSHARSLVFKSHACIPSVVVQFLCSYVLQTFLIMQKLGSKTACCA